MIVGVPFHYGDSPKIPRDSISFEIFDDMDDPLLADISIVCYHENTSIGWINISKSPYLENCWIVNEVQLNKKYQGIGLGLTMYGHAFDLVGSIHPDWEGSVSRRAARIWANITKYKTPAGADIFAVDPGYTPPTQSTKGVWNIVGVNLEKFFPFFEPKYKYIGFFDEKVQSDFIPNRNSLTIEFKTKSDDPEVRKWLRCAFLLEPPINYKGVEAFDS